MTPRSFPVLAIALCLLPSPTVAETREWTNQQGRTITAEFLGEADGRVSLRLPNGKTSFVPLASLSEGDQAWIRSQATALGASASASPAPPAPTGTARKPWNQRHLPAAVREPLMAMNIRVIQETEGECVYESANFRFKTTAKLGQALMKDVCRAFESTHELVRQLPWGIVPRPEEGRKKFEAEFYETREGYLATGAPPWSGGLYSRRDKVFRMPFEQLGLERQAGGKSSGYTRSGPISNDTITHEITHQMMHEYLPYAPIWIIEGTAEYTANLAYRSGVFDVARSLDAFKDMRTARGARRRDFNPFDYRPQWIGAPALFALGNSISAGSGGGLERQSQLLADRYFSSHAIVFYFMHLDGDGDAARMKRYFDALHGEKQKWSGYWKQVDAYNARLAELKPEIERYEREMAEFVKQPGVKDLGDGRFSHPSDLAPPEEPKGLPEEPVVPDGEDPKNLTSKHLDVLLDGRTLEQLEQLIRAAFDKAGVPL